MMKKSAILAILAALILIVDHKETSAAPGELDPTFGVGGKIVMPVIGWLTANRTLTQPDGKFLTIGFDDGPSERFSFRHNSNGVVDTTFIRIGVAQNVDFQDFAIQPDLKIVAVRDEGYLVGGNYRSAFGLHRFNSNGTIDTNFGINGIVTTPIANNGLARHIAIQSDGKIVVAGMATDSLVPYPVTGADYKIALARYHPNGAIDETFGINGVVISDGGSCRLYIQADDKSLCRNQETVHRYNLDGSADNGFGSNGKIHVGPDSGAMALHTNGKIVVGSSNGSQTTIRRYLANGTSDTTFGNNGTITSPYSPRAIAIQRNGKIVAGGELNGNFVIGRYNQDGWMDTTFGNGGSLSTKFEGGTASQVHELLIQPDNKIIAAGSVAIGSYYSSSPAMVRYLNDPLESFVEISGKVLTPGGLAVRNALVSLVDSHGVRTTTTTSSFGIFRFGDLATGESYSLTASSKRYRFAPRILQNVNNNLTNVDLVGLE